MKKLFVSIVATFIMSGVAVYAEGGKSVTKKHVSKKECTKEKCPDKSNCQKAICPVKPGCVCN